MTERPAIDPAFLAELTDAVPRRLIAKLDKKPELAEAWSWERDGEQTIVTTDKEAVVHIEGDVVSSPEHLRCSCLLAPKCLHRLAIATRLPLADARASTQEPDDPDPELATSTPLSEREREALGHAETALMSLLSSGVTSAGSIVQAELYRGLHEARGAKLHRLAALLHSTVQRVRAVREGEDDLATVLDLATSALALCWKVDAAAEVSTQERGVGRRRYDELGPTLLWGIASAPFQTETGFAGVTTWLLDRKGEIHSVSSVRPSEGSGDLHRDAKLAAFAHASITHATLSRSHVVLHGGSVSADRRIGTGKSVRVAETGVSSLFAEPVSMLFGDSLDTQLERVWAHHQLPPLHRPAGWDLLFVDAVLDAETKTATIDDRVVRLTELNSTAGVDRRLRVIARWIPARFRTLEPIALAIQDEDYERWDVAFGVPNDGPELREWFQRAPKGEPHASLPEEPARHPWTTLERATLRAMSGGWRAFPAHRDRELKRERGRLQELGLVRGSDLLGVIHRSALPTSRHRTGRYEAPAAEPFAAALTACALYLGVLREIEHRAAWRA